MQTVSKAKLKQWMDQRQDMLLVDVLSKENYNKKHIPGSISVPLKDNPNFLKDMEARATSKTQRIVVYCANTACEASRQAAERLESAGYTNVHRFEEGIEGWLGEQPQTHAA